MCQIIQLFPVSLRFQWGCAMWLQYGWKFPNRVTIIVKMNGDSRSSAQLAISLYLAGDSEQDQKASVISALTDGETED